MMPSAMIQPRLARSASIPEPRPRGGWISEALVIAVPFHVSMLMRDPAQKVITRQGVTIDLDQAGAKVVECRIETALVRLHGACSRLKKRSVESKVAGYLQIQYRNFLRLPARQASLTNRHHWSATSARIVARSCYQRVRAVVYPVPVRTEPGLSFPSHGGGPQCAGLLRERPGTPAPADSLCTTRSYRHRYREHRRPELHWSRHAMQLAERGLASPS